MVRHKTIETDTWTLAVPEDWRQQEPQGAELYLESEDGTKGLYISAWDLSGDIKTQSDALRSFLEAEENGFNKMPDSHWRVMERAVTAGRVASAILDCYDKNKLYRIACKTLVQIPVAVRASFHDYDCNEYEDSKFYFEPIIESLELRA
jgi:hypothetical protein